MAEEGAVAPPDIWRFDECSAVNTDQINMKEYKPTAQFYTDSGKLCEMYGIKMHPIFREPVLPADPNPPVEGAEGEAAEPKRVKEPTTIIVNKYRLDANSMKVLFKVLEGCPHI
tara:strand:- start:1007 stop:1348 length:342 start_codon:yes stop_codon:yes gene_type:complete